MADDMANSEGKCLTLHAGFEKNGIYHGCTVCSEALWLLQTYRADIIDGIVPK